jgi:hypothetical protein
MSEKNEKRNWSEVNKYRYAVNFSNVILIPWFFLGLLFSKNEVFLGIWIIAYVVVSKLFLYLKIRNLKCPACGSNFTQQGVPIAFQKKCASCYAEIGT